MHIELASGKQKLRAQGGSRRSNCAVMPHVLIKAEKKIMPLFLAYKKDVKGFGTDNMLDAIEATSASFSSSVGMWFRTRYELLAGTQIMLDYTQIGTGNASFGVRSSRLLIIADDNAPLHKVQLSLPHHHLASVGEVFFEGRFRIIESNDELASADLAMWEKHAGHSPLEDILDNNLEDEDFDITVLEEEINAVAKVEVTTDVRGRRVGRIRRTRRIKT